METATFTEADLAQHSKRGDLWIAIHGEVYNVSAFLEEHPGGEDVLMEQAGLDATEAFDDIGHSEEAIERLSQYRVGRFTPTVEEVKVSFPFMTAY